ncbi:inner membrane protein [Escherichia coli]|uniref:EAL domain-containing protein n=1 Tax=Escherichia coli TaxID=562 RepID=UPI001919F0A6|nr:cyclic diguanylate phosphodiesterase [Escherichia coli]CAD5645566.1 inner membrane protein [Escherichia coli]
MFSRLFVKKKTSAMVIGSLIFLLIILLTFFWKKAELVNDSQSRVNFALGYIENILNQNNSISPEAEHLLLNNCNADTQRELSALLLKRPQLRALSLARQGAVFCSTHPGFPVGPVAEKERWQHNMLIRFPEDAGTLPWILLKTPYKTGTVITATDYYFIQDIISVVHAVPAIQFRLGNTVLSASGKNDTQLLDDSNIQKEIHSKKYPFSLVYTIPVKMQLIYAWKQAWYMIPIAIFGGILTAFLLSRRHPSCPLDMLKNALALGEFRPYFQPVISAKNHRLTGCEVLIRWHHPISGIIPPDQFIPQAESTGLIAPITQQLMYQVEHSLNSVAHFLPDQFHIGFNISPAHFLFPGLEDSCMKFLSTFPKGKVKLVLELTERNQLSVTAESKVLFAKLHQQGVLFALDDFGTGYATHSYLQSFPVDYIKLDKGFVQMVGVDEISGHIVENIIELACRLGIDIIAEGIETESQELFMTEKGVSYLQGYRYAPPLPAEQFIAEWIYDNKSQR